LLKDKANMSGKSILIKIPVFGISLPIRKWN
jgi:hypothetical protein